MQKKFFFSVELPLGIEVDGSFVARDGWVEQITVGRDVTFEPARMSVPHTETERMQLLIQQLIERKYALDIADTRPAHRDIGPIRLGRSGY